MSLTAGLRKGAQRVAYSTAQISRLLWYTGHYAAGRRIMGPLTAPGEAPYAEEFGPLDRNRLRDAFRELFKTDWRNIDAGIYKMPHELRRAPSPAKLWRQSRDYLRDAKKIAARRREGGHSEVLREDLREDYPRYFLQNFHFQSDGWLSTQSAERYDMQVETIFTGAGDAMRRQALPLIGEAISWRDPGAVRLLDLGCGTGSFLSMVMDNWPRLEASALDLSPAYLGKARLALAEWPEVDFIRANAEETGLEAESFDIVTAVYLFHELPPKARVNVLKEAARLLKPGGTFILADTIQYSDEPGFDILLENFPRGFHEPYYDSFCRMDLAAEAEAAGLVHQRESLAFLTKNSVFRKPSV